MVWRLPIYQPLSRQPNLPPKNAKNQKYGEGNGGRLEVSVGDDFQFIMMDARGYETLGEMPLRNLMDSEGNQYLCYTPLQGMDSAVPKKEACALLDGWLADQY